MKNILKLITLASIAAMTAGTSSAVTLADDTDYVAASTTNTFDVSTSGPVVGWVPGTVDVDAAAGFSFGQTLNPGLAVTTLTDLIQNQVYNVGAVYTNFNLNNTNFAAGLASDELTSAPTDNDNATELEGLSISNPNVTVYLLDLGEVAADENGELQVFFDDAGTLSASTFFSYAGVTLQAVPEPSSLALLGLAGGLGLLRRRR